MSMTNSHNRPRVFVSSTIRDFVDLRSALKFWLEEMGFEVRMSEFNDFERQPDQGTFESCFAALAESDYYVLLIGGSRGSWYTKGISVTQQEYRIAAGLADQGAIKPVIFIRRDVDTVLRERRALSQDSDDFAHRALTSSVVVDDPEFTSAFVDEVRQRELRRPGSPGPAGTMWRYSFTTFRDIVDALRVNLRADRSIRRQALLANLRWELVENLMLYCHQLHGEIQPTHALVTKIRETIPVHPSPTEYIELDRRQAFRLSLFSIVTGRVARLGTTAIREALSSGEFLVFDQQSQRLQPGIVQEYLYHLIAAAERAVSTRTALAEMDREVLPMIIEQNRVDGPVRHLPNLYLGTLYGLHDAVRDSWTLTFRLLRYIGNPSAPLEVPELSPTTPFAGQVETVKVDYPNHVEIEAWIEKLINSFDDLERLMAEMEKRSGTSDSG